MGDLNNLQKLYEKNKYILAIKDNYLRNLLHYSVIGEYYEITKFLFEKGINFDESDYFFLNPT
jgi:ankyrin repeat protein